MMSHETTVGIVGCNGSLGSQMAVQACSQFFEVIGYDTTPINLQAEHGIDQNISTDTAVNTLKRVRRLDILLHDCDIVHWCAPSSTVQSIEALHKDTLLVLHDSVMSTSQENAKILTMRLGDVGKIAIAHCLMNEQNRVVIAKDFGASAEAFDHVKQLGLSPMLKTVQEHDYIAARSQAVSAVLVKTLLSDLVHYEKDGMLTQSAHELLRSLQHRESRWTIATMTTMLANPELPTLMNELAGFIANHQSNK